MGWLLLRLGMWLVYRCSKDQTLARINMLRAMAGRSIVIMNAHLNMPKGEGPKPIHPKARGGVIADNIFETHVCGKA